MPEDQQKSNRLALVTGAAGCIGSQLADALLASGSTVIGADDLSRGVEENLSAARAHPRFDFISIDLADESAILQSLVPRLRGLPVTEVWHMAANSDISAGVRDPRIDHRNTFMTTFNTLQLMKELGIPEIMFASSSAVYGEHLNLLTELTGPLLPISNYGAMKLASEGLISAAAEAHLERAFIFRFPNVVGPRLTHGVIYDLLNKLRCGPDELEVLGDGTQRKPYLHVNDLIDAMLFVRDQAQERVNLFNIGPPDEGATVEEIAKTILDAAQSNMPIRYTGGDRGWVGDVPRVRYSVEKLAKLGWHTTRSSIDAVRCAIAEVIAGVEAVACR